MNSVEKTASKDCLNNLDERQSNIVDRLQMVRSQLDYLVNGAKPTDKTASDENLKISAGDPHISRLVDRASRAQFIISDIENLLAQFRFG